jgi:hypothetical protein
MSTWSDLGLPYPEAPGYSYVVDPGLQRTPFAAAAPRQSRQFAQAKKTFTLNFLLSVAQLKIATNFLEQYGFQSFSIELLSGAAEDLVRSHNVKLIKDFSVSALAYNTYRLSADVESLAVLAPPAPEFCSEVVFFKQTSGTWVELAANPTISDIDPDTMWLAVGLRFLSGAWGMLPYDFVVNEPPDENGNSDLLVTSIGYDQQNLQAYDNSYSYGSDPVYWEFEARWAGNTITVGGTDVRVLWVFQAVKLNPSVIGTFSVTPRPLACICAEALPTGVLTIGV